MKRAGFLSYKLGRTLVVTFSVYQMGKVHGIMMHAADPHEVEKQMIIQTVESAGGTRIVTDKSNAMYRDTSGIAKEVLDAAWLHCSLKRQEVIRILEIIDSTNPPVALPMGGGGGRPNSQHKVGVRSSTGNNNLRSRVLQRSLTGIVEDSADLDLDDHDAMGAAQKNFVERVFAGVQAFFQSKEVQQAHRTSLEKVVITGFTPGVTLPIRLQMARNESSIRKLELPNADLTPDARQNARTWLIGELEYYNGCLKKLRGNWDVTLYDSAQPNAFVTATVPRKIFVSSAMFSHYGLTRDELGFILSHEVSHLLLDHTEENTEMQLWLDIAYILLISVIPAELVALGDGLKWVGSGYVAANSREHEHEADRLGLFIASRGCFDVKKGILALKKIADRENAKGEKTVTWHDTHPPSTDRYAALRVLTAEMEASPWHFNPMLDMKTRCGGAVKMLQTLWK